MTRRSFLAGLITAGTAVVAGCATTSQDPTATATPTSVATDRAPTDATPTHTPTPTRSPTPTATATPTADIVIDVGPEGALRFEPVTFTVGTGETVRWVFRSPRHNVKVLSAPEASSWTGTPGEEFDTFPAGARYHHTFDVPGEYEYYCAPHLGSGMSGSFTVDG